MGRAAITFVGDVGTNGDTTSGTSISVTVGVGGVAAGDTLVVAFAMDPSAGTVSCGDSRGNVYVKDADVTSGSGTSGVRTVIFSAPITVSLVAGDTITVTHPTVAAKAISVSEFSGLAPSGATDRTSTAAGTSATPSSGFTAATNQVDELLVGALGVETSAAEGFTPGSGYTALTPGSSGSLVSATSNVTVNPEYRVVAAKGSYGADGILAVSRLWGAAVASYRARCGNGTVDVGEPCDKGAANTACCSASCTLEAPGTVCRAAADVCDAAETCSGASAACPADGFLPAGTGCRGASDLCDAAETCSGTGAACPADALSPVGTVCRGAADACDVAELCTGSSAACVADGFQPAGTVCRGAADTCDAAELCTGGSAACPADVGTPGCTGPPPGIAFVKHVAAGGETTSSTATSVTVPSGGVAADAMLIVAFAMDPATGTVTCGDVRGNVYTKDADVANGSGTSGVRTVLCSAPITVPLVAGDTITVTHPAAAAKAISVSEFAGLAPSGGLDRTATGTGTGVTPSSGFTAATRQGEELVIGAIGVETQATEPFTPDAGAIPLPRGSSGAVGTATANVTLNPEFRIVSAIGSYAAGGTIGPSRLWGAAVATYRAKCGNGTVDAGEPCDKGVANSACCSATCQLEAASTVCRVATAVCDAAETCTGASASCPADGFQPSGTICRTPTDLCDAAETCTGTATACPADGVQPAGTVCRGVADACDAAELCTGASASCPADAGTPGCSGPPPGLGFVKTVGASGDATSSTATAVTVPVSGVVADDTLIVVFAMDPATGTVSCGDTKGNVYTKDADVTNGTGVAGVRTVVFSAPVTFALDAGDTISVAHPTVAAKAMSVGQFAGLAPSGVLDRTATATGTSATPSSGFTAGTRQLDELLVGVAGVETHGVDPFVAGTGYTPLPSSSSGAAGGSAANVSLYPEFRVVSAVGSYGAGGTIAPARLWATAIATYRAKCGNAVVDPGEPCDGAAADSACCLSTCQLVTTGTPCRAATDVCDAAETCTGTSGACPADGFLAAGAACRAAADLCDAAEVCSGADAACPADALQAAGAPCRPAGGACDVAETCTGASAACPADGVAAAGATCRAAAGPCDVPEACTGTSAVCPADAKSTAVCRPAAGPCDAEEPCDGGADACPPDGYLPPTTVCRPAAAACDVADRCTGTSPVCPADTGEPDGDDDGVCDAADRCPIEVDAAQEDADADGLGDACDPCTNRGPVLVSGPVLTIGNLHTPGGDDVLTWKGTMTLPTAPSIDPAVRGVRVLIADALGSPVLDVVVPGGAGWKAKRRGTAWQYTDRAARLGLGKVVITGSRATPGRFGFVVQGKGGSYPASAWKDPTPPARLPLSATLVLDPPVARDGQCGEAVFARQCAFSTSGKRLRCE